MVKLLAKAPGSVQKRTRAQFRAAGYHDAGGLATGVGVEDGNAMLHEDEMNAD